MIKLLVLVVLSLYITSSTFASSANTCTTASDPNDGFVFRLTTTHDASSATKQESEIVTPKYNSKNTVVLEKVDLRVGYIVWSNLKEGYEVIQTCINPMERDRKKLVWGIDAKFVDQRTGKVIRIVKQVTCAFTVLN